MATPKKIPITKEKELEELLRPLGGLKDFKAQIEKQRGQDKITLKLKTNFPDAKIDSLLELLGREDASDRFKSKLRRRLIEFYWHYKIIDLKHGALSTSANQSLEYFEQLKVSLIDTKKKLESANRTIMKLFAPHLASSRMRVRRRGEPVILDRTPQIPLVEEIDNILEIILKIEQRLNVSPKGINTGRPKKIAERTVKEHLAKLFESLRDPKQKYLDSENFVDEAFSVISSYK